MTRGSNPIYSVLDACEIRSANGHPYVYHVLHRDRFSWVCTYCGRGMWPDALEWTWVEHLLQREILKVMQQCGPQTVARLSTLFRAPRSDVRRALVGLGVSRARLEPSRAASDRFQIRVPEWDYPEDKP